MGCGKGSDELASQQRFKERGRGLSGQRKNRKGLARQAWSPDCTEWAGRSSGPACIGKTLGFPPRNEPSKMCQERCLLVSRNRAASVLMKLASKGRRWDINQPEKKKDLLRKAPLISSLLNCGPSASPAKDKREKNLSSGGLPSSCRDWNVLVCYIHWNIQLLNQYSLVIWGYEHPILILKKLSSSMTQWMY